MSTPEPSVPRQGALLEVSAPSLFWRRMATEAPPSAAASARLVAPSRVLPRCTSTEAIRAALTTAKASALTPIAVGTAIPASSPARAERRERMRANRFIPSGIDLAQDILEPRTPRLERPGVDWPLVLM